jgi:uncharacterized protein
MRTDKIRHWLLAAALAPLLFAPITASAQAQQTPGATPSRPNGHYLGSLLKEPNAEIPCPPGIDPLYQADVIVTGTDMRQRPWGFGQTLRSVLVKSSGDPRLKDDPRIAELATHADDLVLCFSYTDMMAGIPLKDDQGTYDRPHKLTVAFDPARIDAILAQFGDKPWHGERPIIVPAILVRGPKPPPYLLSTETPRGGEQRGAFATWADELDMKTRIPGEAEFAAWGFTADRLPADLPPSPEGETIVAGTLDWSESLPGWVGQWHCRWHGANHAWGISGVSYDAAFRNLIGGVMLLASGNGSAD